MRIYKIVEVTWIDAHAEVGQALSTESALSLEPMICRTVGHLIKRDGVSVVVAAEVGSDDEAPLRDVVCIPSAMITKVRTLR